MDGPRLIISQKGAGARRTHPAAEGIGGARNQAACRLGCQYPSTSALGDKELAPQGRTTWLLSRSIVFKGQNVIIAKGALPRH